jgi:nitronate monooxygenase
MIDIAHLLGIRLPLVQAPMAGVSTAAMAAAVSRAGGLGSIAIGALQPEAADEAVSAALQAAPGPINVNVFVHPRPARDARNEAAWLDRLSPLFEALGATPPSHLEEIYRPLEAQPAMLEVLLDHRPPVVSFHFGIPSRRVILALKAYGGCLLATATSVAEARAIEAAGIDVVIAQGYEAGGHRGAFLGSDERLTTLTLVPRIVAAVGIPVLAAGGITCGRGVAAALMVGAAGAQLGTAFIDTEESAASAAHRRALRNGAPTAMTAVLSGRPARGIVNRLMRELADAEHAAPAYPLAYHAAKQLAAAAQRPPAEGSDDFAALWAGQGLIRHPALPAEQLVAALATELAEAMGHGGREGDGPERDA